MVFHRMKIRTEAAKVAEINEEKIRGVVRTSLIGSQKWSPLWGNLWSPPDEDSEARRCDAIFSFEILVSSVCFCECSVV